MPDEFEEILPAEEPIEEPMGDAADTMAGDDDLAPLEEAGALDVSDTMAESSVAPGQEEIPGAAPTKMPGSPLKPVKPKSNVFTLILILAFLCIGVAIYLIVYELNNFYGVTFNGMMSPPQKTSETIEPAKSEK